MGYPEIAYSQMRSRYYTTRKLLAARFPAWPGSLLLRQPGDRGLLYNLHIDAMLNVDIRSP